MATRSSDVETVAPCCGWEALSPHKMHLRMCEQRSCNHNNEGNRAMRHLKLPYDLWNALRQMKVLSEAMVNARSAQMVRNVTSGSGCLLNFLTSSTMN